MEATTISPDASSPPPPPCRRGTSANSKQPLAPPPPLTQRRRRIVSNLTHGRNHWTGTKKGRTFPPCRRPPRPPCLPNCTSCPIHQNLATAQLPTESSIFIPDSYHMAQGIVKLELWQPTMIRASSSTVILANYHNGGREKNVQPLPILTPVLPLVLEAIDATDKVSVHILRKRTTDRNNNDKDGMVARRVSRYSDCLDKVMEKTREMTKTAYPLVPSNPPPRFFPTPFSIKKVMLRTKDLILRRRIRLRRLVIKRRQHVALITIHTGGEEGHPPPPVPAKTLLLAVMKSMEQPARLDYYDEEGFEGSMDVMVRNYMVAFKKLLRVTKQVQLEFDRERSR